MDFGNGQEFIQTLDVRLMPYTLKVSKNGSYVQDMEYLYDANRRVEHQKNLLNTADSRHYLYDGAGRLERATATQWGQADYSYDGLGNLYSKSFSDWNGAVRTVTNTYDSQNRIYSSHDTANILYGFNHDARGNVTLTGGMSFTYDMSDQPVAMSGTAPNTGTSVTASYLYDGNMKRVRAEVNGKTLYNVFDASGALIHVDTRTDGDERIEKGFSVGVGVMGENITTRNIDLLGLPRGSQLSIGTNAIVEITGLRNPYKQLEDYQKGLLSAVLDKGDDGELIRKSGVMGIVVLGGKVQTGDDIKVSLPNKPHLKLERV